jgi:hypothetical protein
LSASRISLLTKPTLAVAPTSFISPYFMPPKVPYLGVCTSFAIGPSQAPFPGLPGVPRFELGFRTVAVLLT